MKRNIGSKIISWPENKRLKNSLLFRSSKSRVITLFITALLFYALLIALFYSIGFGADLVSSVADPSIESHPDIPFYQFRTSAILDGQVPYLDFDTESPPLIMYLMIPAAVLGNSLLAYAVMFSGYAFITAGLLYALVRRKNEVRGLVAAAFFLFNPITWATAVIFIQDEIIVTLFYALPILLLLVNKSTWSASLTVLGTMTKVFSIVLVPLVIMKQQGRARIQAIVAAGATLLALAVPFIILAGKDFLFFLDYYASQSGTDGQNEGISIWRFLHDAGLSVPGLLLQSLFAAGTLIILYIIWKRDIEPVRSGFLLLMPFFLFFPKIFTCYFIIPFSILCLLSWEDRRPAILVTMAAFLAFFCQFFDSLQGSVSFLPTDGLWMAIPIVMSLTIHAVWIYITWNMLRDDAKLTDGPPSPDTRLHSDL